jgi:signal transduction histidine kinase
MAGSPPCPPRARARLRSGSGRLLGAANLTMRLLAFAVASEQALASPWPERAVEEAVLVLVALATAGWMVADRAAARVSWLSPQRVDRIRFTVLALIAVSCAAAGELPDGGCLMALAFIALVRTGHLFALAPGLLLTGASAGATAAVDLAVHPDRTSAVISAVQLGGLLLGGLLLGLNRRESLLRAEQAAALARQAEQLRREQARVSTLDERARIAREIHDILAHSLGALGVQVQLAQAVLTDRHDEARAVELLEGVRRIAADGLVETRRAVQALRDPIGPLHEGLALLGADHERRHGVPVRLQVSGEPRALPADAGLALTRTAQEALVNAAKHAPRQPLEMRLDYAADGTCLVVSQQLEPHAGARAAPMLVTVNGGHGLTGMRERLLLLHGTLDAGPRAGAWVVEARVPR